MPLANLFVSAYIEPLFNLLVSLSTLVFVILVEFLVIWRSIEVSWLRAAGLTIIANVLSTAAGYGVLSLAPASWDVSTSRESVAGNVIVPVLLGYVFCFTFSSLIEAGFYSSGTKSIHPQGATKDDPSGQWPELPPHACFSLGI